MKTRCFVRLTSFVLFVLLLILPFASLSAETIKVGNTNTLLTSLIFIAKERGYFSDEGIDVEIVPLKTGGDGLQGINSGELQLYNASDVTFVKHYHQNDKLRIVSTLGQWGNETRLIARSDSNIKTAKDLKGKSVAVHKGLAFHWFLDLLLRRHGLLETDLDVQFMHLAAQPSALADGTVDAFVSREPFLSKASELLNGQVEVIEAPNLMMKRFVLITDDKFLKDNFDDVVKIMKALYRAEQFILEEKEAATALMVKIYKKKHDDIGQHLKEIRLKINLDNHLLYTLEKVTKWWGKIEGYEKPRDINFLNVIVSGPLKQAKPEGVLLYR
mgnify:FL=1